MTLLLTLAIQSLNTLIDAGSQFSKEYTTQNKRHEHHCTDAYIPQGVGETKGWMLGLEFAVDISNINKLIKDALFFESNWLNYKSQYYYLI